MDVKERQSGDRARLRELIGTERSATQRDRWRAVELALGGVEKLAIAATLARSKSFVEDWVYAYRDGGLDAVRPRKPTGRPPKLAPDQEQAFLARVDAGPTDVDVVCTLRGTDLRRILHEEFGAEYSERGVYALMKRLNYASLKPRPIHEKHDPARAQAFKESAPLLFAKRRPSVRTRSSG
jgi:putative transposase